LRKPRGQGGNGEVGRGGGGENGGKGEERTQRN